MFVDDLALFAGKRVLVVYTGDNSLETAINLTEQTGRVVLATPMKRIKTENPDLTRRLDQSDVKVLYESAVLALKGLNEVEKVEMHNLAEDEKYELIADAVIKLALDSNVSGGAMCTSHQRIITHSRFLSFHKPFEMSLRAQTSPKITDFKILRSFCPPSSISPLLSTTKSALGSS